MKRQFRIFSALTAAALSTFGADSFYLKDGDRVVFYGDSITDQRLYTVLTETYVVTRYPNLNVTFVHSGWGGDKVSGGGGGPIDLRLQRDVVAYKPTVMTIMLGMNDGLYRAETEDTDKTFFSGYKHIVDTMKLAMPGIRITAIQPSPYDDVTRAPNFPGGYNEVLISFGKWIANYGKEAGLNVADLNTGVVQMLRRANELSPEEAQKIISDRVHPGFSGHLIMAEQLLKSWNVRPVVAAVAIDAASGKATLTSSEHARVSDLTSSHGINWTETDDALPLPFEEWEGTWGIGPLPLVIRSSKVAEDLNSEPLKITGLKSGVYTVKIDGSAVGTFNNDELARGVNLALLDTPMVKQAKQVYDLTVSHCDIHNQRWRTIQVPLASYNLPQMEPALQSADSLEQAVIAKRHEVGQPKAHYFEVIPLA